MKKIIKTEICPKCGAKHKGFYINPVCHCGHMFRQLNGWELHLLGGTDKEFRRMTVFEKRYTLREIEWSWPDVKLHLMLLIFPVLAFIVAAETATLSDITRLIMTLIAAIMFDYILFKIVLKTIYFDFQTRKDKKYFNIS